MDRVRIEIEIWQHEFPLYTPGLRRLINEVHSINGLSEWDRGVDPRVVDALWAKNASVFADINVAASGATPKELKTAKLGRLTESGRAAITEYLNRADAISWLDDADLLERYDELSEKWGAPAKAKRQAAAEQRDRSAFFNRKAAKAGLDGWHRKKAWSLEEAVALSFDRNPDIVNLESLQAYKSIVGSVFRDGFFKRIDQAERAITAKSLVRPELPVNFVKWCRAEELVLGPEIDSAFSSSRANLTNETATQRKLQSCYKILLSVLTEHYQLDPEANFSDPNASFETLKVDKACLTKVMAHHHLELGDEALLGAMTDALAWARRKAPGYRKPKPAHAAR